jgi:hypothetical protein
MCLFLRNIQVNEARYFGRNLLFFLFLLKLNLNLHALYFKCVSLYLDVVLLQYDFRSTIH